MEQTDLKNTAVVILAGGKGKRLNELNNGYPKALTMLDDQPMITYLLSSVQAAGFGNQIVIVVGHNAELVREAMGDHYTYAIQREQLGTGHAVSCAENLLKDKFENIMVLYSDNPLVSSSTVRKLHVLHEQEKTVLTMLTTQVQNFNSWRAPLYDFGRIIRDESGKIIDIREKKDASEDELNIREVNPSLFIFKGSWLWNNLRKLENKNSQGEYYLTDLVKIAISQDERIFSMLIDPFECLGVNTPEQLAVAEHLIREREM